MRNWIGFDIPFTSLEVYAEIRKSFVGFGWEREGSDLAVFLGRFEVQVSKKRPMKPLSFKDLF